MRAAAVVVVVGLAACAAPTPVPAPAPSPEPPAGPEQLYVLRSIREPTPPDPSWCVAARAGFEPFAADAERVFSFWSVQARPEDGRIVDAHVARVAALRGCFGATDTPARQHFYAELQLGELALTGRGECVAANVNFPEPGLFPVRCQLWLTGPAPFVGGLLTTNTIASKAGFGGESDPAGYTQASIATIRLWKGR